MKRDENKTFQFGYRGNARTAIFRDSSESPGTVIGGRERDPRSMAFMRRIKTSAVLVAAVLMCISGIEARAADPVKGRELYTTHCAMCHGKSGRGAMPGTPDFTRGDALLRPDSALLNGIKAGKGAMPAYYGMLTDREILDLITYPRSLR